MNKWICVTGIDGSGKTNVCNYFMELLGDKAHFMKIPYFDWARDMIKISKDSLTDMLVFSACNRLEMYLIKDVKKDFLVTQRCWLDNFPYRRTQGISLEESISFLQPESFRTPDLLFYLRCPYDIAYNRIKDQNGDKYETLDFMEILEKEFDKMFDDIQKKRFPIDLGDTRIITLDSNKPLEKVKEEAKDYLSSFSILPT